MKKTFRSAIAVLALAATALCVASCGKQKPSSVDSTAQKESTESATDENVKATPSSEMAKYDAAFFKGDSVYQTTPSGLKYVTVVPGTGVSPKATDIVLVHYTGRHLDGTVFDSSVSRGEPAIFPLNRVIPGWTEGLQLMQTGGKAVFYIPSDIAYGPQGTPGGPIGPNEDLIFEVELIQVEGQQ